MVTCHYLVLYYAKVILHYRRIQQVEDDYGKEKYFLKCIV